MTDIILDCDPGHDDAIALLLALASPEVRLLGVTTVSGNQTLEKTTANAIRVLDHVGRADVPVAAGAARPLIRARNVAADVHGETGLDGPDLPPAAREPEPTHAIDWIAHALEASATPVTLVPTGPLTNIALFLTRYPELAAKVERVVLMGGAVGEGNTTPAAEFNIWADPEAAHLVFTSGLDLTMVGLDVTHKALITPAHVDAAGRRRQRRASSSPTCSTSTACFTGASTGGTARPSTTPSRWPMSSTRRCSRRRIAASSSTPAANCPADARTSTSAAARGQPNCHVAIDIDAERFLGLLVERISSLG